MDCINFVDKFFDFIGMLENRKVKLLAYKLRGVFLGGTICRMREANIQTPGYDLGMNETINDSTIPPHRS